MKLIMSVGFILMMATASYAGVMIEDIKDFPLQAQQAQGLKESVSIDEPSEPKGFLQFMIMAFLMLI
jgi:hypothetical protein